MPHGEVMAALPLEVEVGEPVVAVAGEVVTRVGEVTMVAKVD
jgi:hypothetical protein